MTQMADLTEEAIKALEEYLKKHPWDYHEEEDIRCLLFRELRKRYDQDFESGSEKGQLMGQVHTEFGFKALEGRKRIDIVVFDKDKIKKKIDERHRKWLVEREKEMCPLEPSDLIDVIEMDQWASNNIPPLKSKRENQDSKEKQIDRIIQTKKKLEQLNCRHVRCHLVIVWRDVQDEEQAKAKIEEAKIKGIKVHLIKLP